MENKICGAFVQDVEMISRVGAESDGPTLPEDADELVDALPTAGSRLKKLLMVINGYGRNTEGAGGLMSAVSKQAMAGVLANRIAADTNNSLCLHFMETAIALGLSFKLAGVALQQHRNRQPIWMAVLIIIWIPIGFLLPCLRIPAGALLLLPIVYYAFKALGVRVTIKGTPPPPAQKSIALLDPIFLSTALGRPDSVSRLSELISPIKTVRLNRDRVKDANMIKKLLEEGDLVTCPEGTTCREPFLLRFSALFAELTDEIVPVVMSNRMSMFHGTTTARGWMGMDPFYVFMNPSPVDEVTFLNELLRDLTTGGGKSSHDLRRQIIWMGKIGDMLTASAIIISLAMHLPPVMACTAAPLAFLIIALAVVFA